MEYSANYNIRKCNWSLEYYGGSTKPKATAGYRKDLGGGAYISCQNGSYVLKASNITIQADSITLVSSKGSMTLGELMDRLDGIEERLDSIGEET